jgi:uracil-DNA glycosylase
MEDSLRKFHQQQMRILLQYLDTAKKSWVFTDLIKCFVWHGFDKKSKLHGNINWLAAIKYCRRYLDQQIDLLQPRRILGLGGTVAKYFGLDKPQHGSVQRIDSPQCLYVHSLFPSQWTADQWIAQKGWEKVIQNLVKGEA